MAPPKQGPAPIAKLALSHAAMGSTCSRSAPAPRPSPPLVKWRTGSATALGPARWRPPVRPGATAEPALPIDDAAESIALWSDRPPRTGAGGGHDVDPTQSPSSPAGSSRPSRTRVHRSGPYDRTGSTRTESATGGNRCISNTAATGTTAPGSRDRGRRVNSNGNGAPAGLGPTAGLPCAAATRSEAELAAELHRRGGLMSGRKVMRALGVGWPRAKWLVVPAGWATSTARRGRVTATGPTAPAAKNSEGDETTSTDHHETRTTQ